MTDLANSAAPAASAPGIEPPAGDPELAALVAAPRRGRSLALRFGAAFVFGALLAGGVGVGALYTWGHQYDGRILPGVRIGTTDLGGLTRAEAEAKIASGYGWLGTGQITLTGPDGATATISYSDLHRRLDTSALLDAAMAAGHESEPLADLLSAPRAAIRGVTVDAAVAYDREELAKAIRALALTIDRAPADATVSAGPAGTFRVTPSTIGRTVDQPALLATLDEQLTSQGTSASIATAVPVLSVAPALATTAAESARATADRMVTDVIVRRGADTWTIGRSKLAPLISFSTAADGTITPVFDQARLEPIVQRLATKINQAPKDAGLKRVDGRIVVAGASREGRTLDTASMQAGIVGEILSRQAGAAPAPVPAAIKAVDPKLSTADAEAYAPKMKVISSFSVYYYVIVNNHWGGNIEAPATKIDGTVVPPGGVFDFWKVVGDLRKLTGTGPGNAIEGGKITVTGAFGGGICTTSTTLFNAAFRAGMIPMARQNHNEFINRYPPGLDATVWIVGSTKQTMSFKNDTKYPILIQRVITQDGSRRWITFKIWSVPNGRVAKVTNTVIQNGPRAIETVVRDPTKPVGYYFRNNAPADGAKVWVTVSIYDHGKLHWSKRYFSNYPAVNGVTIVGTKKS
jgi:vancomycin resistance protein YoaR